MLVSPGRWVLADVQRPEHILENTDFVDIVVLAEHIEESRLSESTRPEEHVSVLGLIFLELLNVRCLIGKYHSSHSAPVMEVRDAIR